MLLEHNIMQCLSDMRVFDQHPDLPYFSTVEQYEISPSNMRFQQVIIPTLKFLKSILITLGTLLFNTFRRLSEVNSDLVLNPIVWWFKSHLWVFGFKI